MDVLVIGGGLSGMMSALMAREAGARVTLVTSGLGGVHHADGYVSLADSATPMQAVEDCPSTHPYSKTGVDSLREGIAAFRRYIPVWGDSETAPFFPTALGALRRASFVPASYAQGAVSEGARYVLVGLSGMKDFYPALAAGNLARGGISADYAMLDMAVPGGETALAWSRFLDAPGEAEKLGARVGVLARGGERVGIPAVMSEEAFTRCADVADVALFQIPCAPPSVVGGAWAGMLRRACAAARIDVRVNSRAVGFSRKASRITSVRVSVAGSVRDVPCDAVIYSGGGIDSGAIARDSYGRMTEGVFGLPVYGQYYDVLDDTSMVVNPDFWAEEQPLFACGLGVDNHMRPLDEGGDVAFENVYATGSMLAGALRAREKSDEGISLASAARAVSSLLGRA